MKRCVNEHPSSSSSEYRIVRFLSTQRFMKIMRAHTKLSDLVAQSLANGIKYTIKRVVQPTGELPCLALYVV